MPFSPIHHITITYHIRISLTFFYVWLKRTLGDVYPELFSTPLTPKGNEIVAYSHGIGGFEEGKRFFEESLRLSFQEILPRLETERWYCHHCLRAQIYRGLGNFD